MKQLMAIKGIGRDSIAGFLAEVGDIECYRHPKQIIKLAGLNLKENTSGKHKGQTKITKRGCQFNEEKMLQDIPRFKVVSLAA